MITVIYGADSFRSRLKLKEYIGKFNVEIDWQYFDFNNLALDKVSVGDIISVLKTDSLFGSRKYLVIKDLFSMGSDAEAKRLAEFIKINKFNSSDSVNLVFYEGSNKPKNSGFNQIIKTAGKAEKLDVLEANELFSFIKGLEQEWSLSLDPEARQALLSTFKSDSEAIYHLLYKLSLYKTGKISIEDLEKVLILSFDSKIFDLLDALSLKENKKSLRLLEHELKTGTDPIYIFNLIIYQVRNLLSVKSLDPSYSNSWRDSGLSYFVFKKTESLGRKFTLSELKDLYKKLAIYDFQIKTGQIMPNLALELIVSGTK